MAQAVQEMPSQRSCRPRQSANCWSSWNAATASLGSSLRSKQYSSLLPAHKLAESRHASSAHVSFHAYLTTHEAVANGSQ
jgi:hypothetical protein